MVKVKGAAKLQRTIRKRLSRVKKTADLDVVVGYRAPYAIYVHELIGMKLKGQPRPSGLGKYWDARKGQGQAKYLEEPSRDARVRRIMSGIVRKTFKKTGDLRGMYLAGLYLQRESQKLVPYETGRLHDSAFTKRE